MVTEQQVAWDGDAAIGKGDGRNEKYLWGYTKKHIITLGIPKF
jgi:hypothetical protein